MRCGSVLCFLVTLPKSALSSALLGDASTSRNNSESAPRSGHVAAAWTRARRTRPAVCLVGALVFGSLAVSPLQAQTAVVDATPMGGGFDHAAGVAVDKSGNIYVADEADSAVKEMPAGCASPSCVTTLGGGFSFPFGVAVDGSGNVYVADTNNNSIKEMPSGCASSSCVTTLGGGFDGPSGVAVDASGNVYVADEL